LPVFGLSLSDGTDGGTLIFRGLRRTELSIVVDAFERWKASGSTAVSIPVQGFT
jgi:hypothetical protein